jgi:hypothetical protein
MGSFRCRRRRCASKVGVQEEPATLEVAGEALGERLGEASADNHGLGVEELEHADV